MKKLHLLYIFLVAIIISACQTELPDPDTDAVYKSITKIYELNEDGSVNYQYKHQLKYLTHFAFNRAYGESFIVYNPEKQKLKINESVTMQADGAKVSSPDNAYNEVLPRFAAGVPAFNHLREMVVTHTGLELGCVVSFDYEVKSTKDYLPFLSDNILLAEKSPIQKMKIIVKIPVGKVLNYKLLNSDIEPKVVTKKGIITYVWNFEQLKQHSFDRNKPHYNETLPRLIFNTATIAEALKTITTENKIPDIIIMKVDDKIKDAKTDFGKLFALQKMMVNEANRFRIPVQHTGYQTRSFADIWKTNGATDIEKTLFLAALLNHYNIKAKPIFAIPKLSFDKNIGQINSANHTYIKADLEKESVIISTTSLKAKNNLAYKLTNAVLIDFDGNIIEIDQEKYNKINKLNLKGNFTLFYDGNIKGKADLTLAGYINPYFEFIKDNKNAKTIAEKAISGIKVNKAKLADWDSDASKISFDFEMKEAAKKQEAYNFLNLKLSNLGFSYKHFDLLTKTRTSPIDIGEPIEEVYDLKMQVPNGYIMVLGNIDTTLTNSVGEVKIKFYHTKESIEIYKKLVLNKKIISVDEYPDFRNIYLLWYNKNYSEIALKERKN